MLFQPSLAKETLAPQYSQLINISPNFGLSGAPQLGHFIEVALAGATTAWVGREPVWFGALSPILEPHL